MPHLDLASGGSGLLVQRKRARDADGLAPGAEQALGVASNSSGHPLPAQVQRKFESSVGADLSTVRVHAGAESATAADHVGAKAYTVGQDIHFGAGNYDPASAGGEHLLAHEVAHTVQQRGGAPTRQHKLEVSSPGDAAEHEADRAADAMVSGHPAVIASAPTSAARQIQRDAQPDGSGGGDPGGGDTGAPEFEPKMSFDLFEIKLPPADFRYVKLSQSIKGKGSIELVKPDGKGGGTSGMTTGGPSVSSKGGVGGKGEMTLAQQHFTRTLLGLQIDEKGKETASFELTTEQLKAQVGLQMRGYFPDADWLQLAGDLNFVFAGVKWEDVKKDPDKIKLAAVEASLGGSGVGMGTIHELGDRLAKTNLTIQYTASAAPNWANIGLEAAKQAAKDGAADAGTEGATTTTVGSATAETGGAGGAAAADAAAAGEGAVVIDSAAVASAAATVIFPLGAAALIVAGFVQTDKNTAASRAAIDMGLKLRNEARAYVSAYVSTIFGRPASGQGALDANVKVMEYMAATQKNRADACADLAARNDYDKLSADIMQKFRDQVYDKGVAEFESKFASQFGLIEKLGSDWGMRGVFRKTFYQILYSDD